MTRKTDDPNPVIGSGDYQFRCHHGWGALPGELEWQTTHGTAVDSQGLVYFTHQGVGKKQLDTVLVFDDKGKFVRSFGKQWHGGGHGIDIRKEGTDEFIYLAHMSKDGPVVKTTLKGEVVWAKGRPECDEYQDKSKPFKPTNVAFSPDGGFFVADGYGSHHVLKYDKDGKLLKVFGGAGDKPGQFQTPHGIGCFSAKPGLDFLIVCDRANARLQTFDLQGNFKMASKQGEFLFPANMDTNQTAFLVPDLHARIAIRPIASETTHYLADDPNWRATVVESLKTKTPIRTQPKLWPAGKFIHPHDACFDAAGNIYVAEWVQGGRITFLKRV